MLLLSTVAFAAKLPEVAVIGVHVEGLDEEGGEAASQSIGEAVERTGVMTFVEPQFASAKLKGREDLVLRDMALGEALAGLEEGRVLYGRAEPDAAIPLLEAAIEDLEAGIRSTGSTSDLLDAYLLLALAQTAMGENDAALSAYRSVVVLDPTLELDPISYPPDIIDSYTSVHDAVLAEGTGSLRVTSRAEGVDVLVDGRSFGVAPVTIEALPAGTHHVYARTDDGLRAYVSVDIDSGENETVALEMDNRMLAPAATSASEKKAQTEGLYAALGAYSQTPLVLLAGESGDDQVSIALYSSRSGNFSQALAAPAGDDPVRSIVDLVPALGSYVTETGDIRPDRVAVTVPALDLADNAVLTQVLLDPNEEVQVQYIESGPKWYVWAAMGGVAAAGAGVGVWAVFLREDGGTTPTDDGTITVVLPD